MAELKAGAVAQRTPDLPYAGLGLRLVAFILDVVVLASSWILFFVGSAFLFLLVRTTRFDRDPTDSEFFIAVGIAIIGYLIFIPLYFVLLLAWRGQTVGKMAVHIKVVRRDGRPVGLGRACLRFLGYPASALPLGIGYLLALFDGERRALHDLLAGTVVVELP